MKKYIVALVCAALCMPLVSCDKEEQGQFGDNSTYLPISDMENVYPLGDVVEVSFTSASSWSVVFKDGDNDVTNNWVTVSTSKGNAGTTPLTITIDPYIDKNNLTEPSSQPRKGTLEFVTDAGKKTFEITQNRAFIKVVEVDDNGNHASEDMGRDDIAFDWSEETKQYKVESNVRWMLDVNVDDDDDDVSVEVNNQEWKSDMLYGQNDNESDELSIAVEYNFVGKIKANVSFIPYQPKNEISTDESLQDLKRTLKVSQDYLYLQVFETLPDSSNDLKNLQSAELIDIDGFSELGGDEKEFYVVYQENLEYNYDINLDTLVSGVDTSCFVCEPVDDSGEFDFKLDNERTVRYQKYSAKFTKANPDFEKARTIPYVIKPEVIKPEGSNIPENACRCVNFVQDAYQFVIKENGDVVESEKVVPNAGGAEYNFKLDTHGKWSVSYPKNVTWASLTFSNANGEPTKVKDDGNDIEVSGSGNATIGVEVANRNLSFDLDNVLNLEFEASSITEDYPQADATKIVDFKQPKFEFEISVTNDDKVNSTNFNVSSHTKKGYAVGVVSSGSWSIVENSDWVSFSGSADGEGNNADAGSLTFNSNEADYPRDFVLKVISKEHKDVEGYEDNYYRELTITQDEMKTNILENDGGRSLNGETRSYAAYKKNEDDRESTFYMECSAPWTLAQKPSWVKLYKGGDELYEGSGVDDGEYYTISMVVDNNFGTESKNGNVLFSVGDKTIGFTVSQDGFVFYVPTFSKTYDPIPSSGDELNITLTNEATLDLSDIDSWVNLTGNGTVDNGKTTTYKYLVKPGPNIENINEDRGGDYNIAVSGIPSLTEIVTIKQQKFEWELNKSELNVFDVISGESQSIRIIKCTTEDTPEGSTRCYDVVIEATDGWLTLSDPNSIGGNLLTFETTSTNTSTTKERTGKIKFIVKHSSVTEEYLLQTINVKQDKYIWSVDYNGETDFDPVCDYEGKIDIKSSGEWKAITNNKDMVSLSSSSGNGDKSVTFTIEPNYTRSERTAVIEISNEDLDDVPGASSKKSFTLTQKAYVFEADKNAVELEATKGGTSSVSFTSSGSGGWNFAEPTDSSDWLKVEKVDDELVVTTTKDNDGKSERKTTITVTDVESELDVKIEVIQKAKAE